MQNTAPVSSVGGRGAHEGSRVHTVHSPGSDEVGKVLHDLQGHASLLPGEPPLVGRVKGQSEDVLNVGQQLQAEKTRGNEEKQRGRGQ